MKSYPLIASLPSWIQFFSKVSQIIIVVEVTQRDQVLKTGNHCFFDSFKNKILLMDKIEDRLEKWSLLCRTGCL